MLKNSTSSYYHRSRIQ